MCSRAVALALVVLAVTSGCGRKAPPTPPPSKVPAPIQDLTAQQRGMEILLRMSYPTVTIGGLPIESLEAVEVWQMSRILPSLLEGPIGVGDELAEEAGDSTSATADAEAPEQAAGDQQAVREPEAEPEEGLLFRIPSGELEEEPKEDLITVQPQEFSALAELRWAVRGSELDAAVLGDSLLVHIPLDKIPEEDEVLVFGVRTLAGDHLESPFSNPAKLLPRQPPRPPIAIAVEAEERGIRVHWEPRGDEQAFRIYRRNASVRQYRDPLSSAAAEAIEFLDTTARFGQRYIYTVTSVASERPLIESAVTAEHEIDYQDRFAPAPPRDLIALPEPGRIRLLWDAADDASEYRIYRQDPPDEFRLITPEPVVGSEYLDRDLEGGRTYRYFVVAVDSAQNQSEASAQVEARVP